MFSVQQERQQERQRGITLLEVLISIGILAIGLVSTLALLPAGGAYLKKASTDNRAAALIHNAVNTMRASGLFKENAIYWGERSENKTDGENQVKGYPRAGRTGEKNVTVPETYTTSGLSWGPRDNEPTLSGTVVRNDADSGVDHDYVVISATRTGQRGGGGTIAPIQVPLTEVDSSDTTFSDGKDYQWSYAVLPGALSGPSPTFQIYDSISAVNAAGDWREFWYDEWDFDVTHNGTLLLDSDINVVPPPTPPRPAPIDHGGDPNSPSSYAHFLERPRHRTATGVATLDYMLSGAGGTNQTSGKATNLRFLPTNERGSRRDPNGRVYFHHSSTFNVTGHLWRYQIGYRSRELHRIMELIWTVNYGSRFTTWGAQ